MKTQEKFILLDRFYADEMKRDEMNYFYELMEVEDSLKEEYTQTNELCQDIGCPQSLEVRRQIASLYAEESLTRGSKHRLKSLWLKIAGVAALFVGVLLVYTLFFNAYRVDVAEEISSENPSLNQRLETLMGSHFRGQEKGFVVPQQDVVVNSGEMLAFDGCHKAFSGMTINLYDVNDDQIQQYQCSTAQVLIPAPGCTGTYYWVLETPEKILEIGRFYVR